MTSKITKILLVGVSLSTLGFASSVQAQSSANVQALEEIVVTATRREERLQDVPLAVSAIAGEQLENSGFQNLTDIQYNVTGVQFGNTPNDAGFRLRGVGSAGGFTSSSEQNVGLVVDGVVVPFGNPIESLGNVERIEVLKGPQGTQFGKNASSGVISITTARPKLGEFGGSAFGSYATLNEYDVHGNVNLPLGETAAADLYLYAKGNDGFIHNAVRGEDWGDRRTEGGRAKLFWQASEALEVNLSADYSRSKSNSPGQLWTLNRVGAGDLAFTAPFVNLATLGVTPGFDNEVSIEEFRGLTQEKNYGVAAELNYALGDFTLTSVSAYRAQEVGPLIYAIDGSPLARFTAREIGTDRNFMPQEFRVTSPSGQRLEYVAGVYLSRNETEVLGASAQLRPALPFAPVTISITAGQSFGGTVSKSTAVFADGGFDLTEQLRLLAGLRYTYDSVEAYSGSRVDPALVGMVGLAPYTPRATSTGETSNGDWSGRIGLQYKPAEDILLFGTVARGYLGPTITFSGLTGTRVAVEPQTVEDITVGAKTQFFDRTLTVNVNAFYDKYEDLQTAVFNGLEFLTENAGGFETTGFEVETTWRPTSNWAFSGGLTYAHTEFTDYVTQCPGNISRAGPAAIAARCNAPGSTAATPLFQAAGNPLNGAPEYTANAAVNYNRPMGEVYALDASLSAYYRSEVFNTAGDPNTKHPAYTTINATLGFGREDGQWRLGYFVRNLTDEHFQSAILGLPFSSGGGYVNWNAREGRRTVGISLEATF